MQADAFGNLQPINIPKSHIGRVQSLIGLREARQRLSATQLSEPFDEAAFKRELAAANRLYDAFVKRHGPILKEKVTEGVIASGPRKGKLYRRVSYPNLEQFRKYDVSYPLVMGLEQYDAATGTAQKGDFLKTRQIRPPTDIQKVDRIEDALPASLNIQGRVDVDYMAHIAGTAPEKIASELRGKTIFEDPTNPGQWETDDVYLSGDVRTKLEDAQKAAKRDPARYQPNVDRLTEVQPKPLPPSEIYVKIGSPWVPVEMYEEFATQIFGGQVKIAHTDLAGGQYRVNFSHGASSSAANTTEFGTNKVDGARLFLDALNQRGTEVTYRDSEGRTHKDAEGTAAAQEKQAALKARFTEWAWEKPDRASKLADIYNATANRMVAPNVSGAHMSIPGTAANVRGTPFHWNPWQLDAIWRIVSKGHTLLAHEVGLGKTFVMQAAAMELRRLGVAKKPLHVVPNHMLEQYASEFQQLYPNANLLVATKRDFAKDRRREFTARMGSQDWDSIVMTHSSFELISMSSGFQKKYITEQMEALENEIREAKADKTERQIVKTLESAREKLEVKLKRLTAQGKKDDLLSFEETGVDQIFVDEAHLFKNLFILSKMRGMAQQGSERAFDLYLKTQYLNQQTPGRGVVFATGTPISNSMAEVYTMQRYLEPDVLRQFGTENFDAWAAMFGESVISAELAPDGSGYRTKERFARFQNLPELSTAFRQVADVKGNEVFGEPPEGQRSKLPPMVGGGPIMITVKPSLSLKGFVRTLINRAEAVRARRVDPSEDNFLKITGEGRYAAMDLRMVSPLAHPDPSGKIATAAQHILSDYHEFGHLKGVQLVFSDIGTPNKKGKPKKRRAQEMDTGESLDTALDTEGVDEESTGADEYEAARGLPGFNVYDELKRHLLEGGIPEKEIAFIHDAATPEAKQRLFNDAKAGRVRVLIGSTEKMGAGTNVQDRVVALHTLDAPWRPADQEQRIGRAIRQGNKLWNSGKIGGVKVYQYGTEESFDAYMWQTLERKAGYIGSFMRGDANMRSLEDLGAAMDYAEMKAATSGNPKVKEKQEVDVAVARMQLQQRQFRDGQATAAARVAQLASKISLQEQYLAGAKKDAVKAEAKDLSGDNFQITIGKKQYADRAAANVALMKVLDALMAHPDTEFSWSGGMDAEYSLGQFGDFPLAVHAHRYATQGVVLFTFRLGLEGANEIHMSGSFDVKDKLKDPASSIASIYRRIGDAPGNYEKSIADEKREMEGYQDQRKKTWNKGDELKALQQRQAELAKELKADEGKNKEEPIYPELSHQWWDALARGEWPYAKEPEVDRSALTEHFGGEPPTNESGPRAPVPNILKAPVVAYHGTPHKFDKFSLEKIGTGEGAQAFGWGLYFAGKKELGEYYRKALAGRQVQIDGKAVPIRTPADRIASNELSAASALAPARSGNPDPFEFAIGRTEDHAEANQDQYPEVADQWRAVGNVIRDWKAKGATIGTAGSLHTVELPDDRTMLDWDEPLSRQPALVQRALKKLGVINPDGTVGSIEGSKDDPDGEAIYTAIEEMAAEDYGPDTILNAKGSSPDEQASRALHSVGINGIRYANADTRYHAGWRTHTQMTGSGPWVHVYNSAGTHVKSFGSQEQADEFIRKRDQREYNYVIFDDQAIKVLSIEAKRQAYGPMTPAKEALIHAIENPNSAEAKKIRQSEIKAAFGSYGAKTIALARHASAIAALNRSRIQTVEERAAQLKAHREKAVSRETVNYEGLRIAGAEGLAKIMDTLRDPGIEHLHLFYQDEGENTLGSNVQSSGSIDAVTIFGETSDSVIDWVNRVARRYHALGAKRLKMAHNHPAGDPTPSTHGDLPLMELVAPMLRARGVNVDVHVVIDHGKYAVISVDEHGKAHVQFGEFTPLPSAYTTPTMPTDHRGIVTPSIVAGQLAGALVPDMPYVIYHSSTIGVVAVEPVAADRWRDLNAWLPKRMIDLASDRVSFMGPESIMDMATRQAFEHAGGDVTMEGEPAGRGSLPGWGRNVLDIVPTMKDGALPRLVIDYRKSYRVNHKLPMRANSRFDSFRNAKQPAELRNEKPKYGAEQESEKPQFEPPTEFPEAAGMGERRRTTLADFRRALQSLFNPESLGEQAHGTAGVIRQGGAAKFRKIAQATRALEALRDYVEKRSIPDKVKLADDYEHGRPTGDPFIDEANKQFKAITDRLAKKLVDIDRLKAERVIENWIGRYWAQDADMGPSVARAVAGKRPFEGPKTFLKPRTWDFFAQGLRAIQDAKARIAAGAGDEHDEFIAGLHPRTYNYVESQLQKIAEMEWLIASDAMLKAEKAYGRAALLLYNKEMPTTADGRPWEYIDKTGKDPAFNVYGPSHGMVGLPDEAKELGLQPEDVRVYGPRVIGRWIAHPNSASVWHNFLSKGVRTKAGAPIYDAITAPGRAATQVLLGFSGFHGTVIATEGMFSDMVIASERAMMGQPGQAARAISDIVTEPAGTAIASIARSIPKLKRTKPAKGAAAIAFGQRVLDEYLKPGTHPEMAAAIRGMVMGGARFTPESELWRGDRKAALKETMRKEIQRAAVLSGRAPGNRLVSGLMLAPGGISAIIEAAEAGIEAMSSPLMANYVPLMKMAATYKAVALRLDQLAKQEVQLSPEQMRDEMWQIVKDMDYRFGQVVYDNFFMHPVIKQIAQLIFFAPGWTAGSALLGVGGVRQLAATPKRLYDRARGAENDTAQPVVGRLAKYLIAALVGTMILNALRTWWNTGKLPGVSYQNRDDGWKDYFGAPDGTLDADGNPNRSIIPGYTMHDWYSWPHHPAQTLANKTNPFIAYLIRLQENRTYFGDMIRNPDDPAITQARQIATDAAKEFAPLSVQNFLEARRRGEGVAGALPRNLLGITPAKREFVRTPAQNREIEYAKRSGHPTATPEQAASRQRVNDLLAGLRRGSDASKAVAAAVENGDLTAKKLNSLLKRVQLMPFQERFKSLTLEQALDVFGRANPWEQQKLADFFLPRSKMP